ncbi:MAG TPA: DUF5317 domain-containing protein [Actinomycetota bacterium]|jgi:hypothetical protein
MIAFILAAVLAGAVALLRGGSLKALADTHFEWSWLLFLGLAMQIVAAIWAPEWLDGAAGTVVIVVSNLLVVAFLVANRTLPGMLLIGLGLAMNVVVIAANGAMPVSVSASRSAGVDPPPPGVADVEHERMDDDTKVPWLGDVLAIPGAREVFSVGDVVLALGIGLLVYRRATWDKRPRRAASGSAASD